MVVNTTNQSPQIPVIHYNKQLHTLLFVLICVTIAGGVIFYQLKMASIPEYSTQQMKEMGPAITVEQRNQALVEVRGAITSSPPITDLQRQAALKQVRKTLSQQ